ncbi:MAG: lipoate--protein ligase family protein [Treponema sp.]|jgi:lipoate-protein ligase A|nr:lipoate--protein ligase family protein [Treponema sp.]
MNRHPFRLVCTGFHDCYYNMGLDEALLESAAAGSPPVLRLYGWSPPAVSVGYFQGLAEEVDLEAAKRRGFDVVRRISGGGAVLHKSEITYSIVMGLDHPLAEGDLGESYRRLCAGIIRGLELLGVRAVFSGVNDVLAVMGPPGEPDVPLAGNDRFSPGDKKISGSAQTRRLGCLLQHGTVLLDNDVDEMFEVLRVPEEKIRGKLTGEAKERVTSLRNLLGREVPFGEAEAALIRGFSEALGLSLEPGDPGAAGETRGRELALSKFSARDWLFKR